MSVRFGSTGKAGGHDYNEMEELTGVTHDESNKVCVAVCIADGLTRLLESVHE